MKGQIQPSALGVPARRHANDLTQGPLIRCKAWGIGSKFESLCFSKSVQQEYFPVMQSLRGLFSSYAGRSKKGME